MTGNDAVILVYTTFPSEGDAKKIGQALVEGKFAACVNIFPQMTALFEWEGEIQEAQETAMLVKTRAGLRARVLEEIKRRHPYTVPALLVLEVKGGSAEFLGWIRSQTAEQKQDAAEPQPDPDNSWP